MVVHFREPEVFERQVPHPLYRFIRRKSPGAHLFEKFANGFRVHAITNTQSSIDRFGSVDLSLGIGAAMLSLNLPASPASYALALWIPV